MSTKLRKVRCYEKNLCFSGGSGVDAGIAAGRLPAGDNRAPEHIGVDASHDFTHGQPHCVADHGGQSVGHRIGHRDCNRNGLQVNREQAPAAIIGIRKGIAACAVLLAALLPGGCMFGGQPGRTAQPKTYTPSPAPTQAIQSPKTDKTASQDTAGAVTRLPEAATAAGATTNP